MMCYVGSVICSEQHLTTFYLMVLQHMPLKVLLLLVAVLQSKTSSEYFPLTNPDGPKPKANGGSYLPAATGNGAVQEGIRAAPGRAAELSGTGAPSSQGCCPTEHNWTAFTTPLEPLSLNSSFWSLVCYCPLAAIGSTLAWLPKALFSADILLLVTLGQSACWHDGFQ